MDIYQKEESQGEHNPACIVWQEEERGKMPHEDSKISLIKKYKEP